VFTKCPNRSGCPGQQFQLLKHFASRGAMDIEGLGEERVLQLLNAGLIRQAGDLYRLTADQLMELEGFGEISTHRLIEAIAASRERPFGLVLFGIGLEEVGYVTGRNLAQHFRSIDALMGATVEQIAEVPGVGPKMAQSIHDQLAEPSMRALIEDLRAQGLRFEQEGPPPGEGPLAGKTFVLTGTLPSLTREQATEQILAAGGRVTSSVSKKTNYLVAGEAAGSKLEKAQRLEVEVIGEDGLVGLLGG